MADLISYGYPGAAQLGAQDLDLFAKPPQIETVDALANQQLMNPSWYVELTKGKSPEEIYNIMSGMKIFPIPKKELVELTIEQLRSALQERALQSSAKEFYFPVEESIDGLDPITPVFAQEFVSMIILKEVPESAYGFTAQKLREDDFKLDSVLRQINQAQDFGRRIINQAYRTKPSLQSLFKTQGILVQVKVRLNFICAQLRSVAPPRMSFGAWPSGVIKGIIAVPSERELSRIERVLTDPRHPGPKTASIEKYQPLEPVTPWMKLPLFSQSPLNLTHWNLPRSLTPFTEARNSFAVYHNALRDTARKRHAYDTSNPEVVNKTSFQHVILHTGSSKRCLKSEIFMAPIPILWECINYGMPPINLYPDETFVLACTDVAPQSTVVLGIVASPELAEPGKGPMYFAAGCREGKWAKVQLTQQQYESKLRICEGWNHASFSTGGLWGGPSTAADIKGIDVPPSALQMERHIGLLRSHG